MNELLTSLAPAIGALADFFGKSVEFIQANLYDYIMKYGRYCYATNISATIFISFAVWLGASIVAGIVTLCILDEVTFDDKQFKKSCQKWIPCIIIILLFIIAFCGFVWLLTTTIIPYAASPEIWSIEQAINKLIK